MSDLDYAKQLYTELNLDDATTVLQRAAKIAEVSNYLSENGVSASLTGFTTNFNLSTTQTGSADSTHVFQYGRSKITAREPLLIKIVTTIGSTPTCTYAIEGSIDGTTYFSLSYSDSASPTTFTTDTFITTTATTKVKIVERGQVYNYLKLVYSSNTNVTNTADVLALGD